MSTTCLETERNSIPPHPHTNNRRSDDSTVVIRCATKDELDLLVDIAEGINGESAHAFTFNRENARMHIWQFLASSDWDIIVAEQDGEIVGGVMLAESLEFHDDPLCYVCKFWVLPNARSTRVGVMLTEAMVDWAREHQCTDVFVTATAGLDAKNQRAFVWLMSRQGFKECGPVMKLTFGGL